MFPGAPEPLIDLSTGINPHAYKLPPLPFERCTRLPEPGEELALREAAALAYGVESAASVASAPGTQVLIGLLPLLFPSARVAVLGPTYAEHAASWRGSQVRMVGALAELSGSDAAVMCLPNNPDGRRHTLTALRALADDVGLLVVDAAFADLEDEPDPSALLPHPRVVVLRSFGKTYGLAGLRLGFALADPERAERIRATLGPWAVSGAALAAGCAALPDRDWRTAMRIRLAREAARLDALLSRAGMVLIGGTRLFRLAAAPDAPERHARLGSNGVLVRRFPEQPQWLRFGIPGDEEAWRRLASCCGVDLEERPHSPTEEDQHRERA